MMNYRETKKAITALNAIYSTSTNPTEAIKTAKNQLGQEVLGEALAAMIGECSHDGRITRYAKAAVAGIVYTKPIPKSCQYYDTDGIHRAHLSQLAEAFGKEG